MTMAGEKAKPALAESPAPALELSRRWPRHGRRRRGNGGYDTNHQLGHGLVANFIPGA
jgi:hypothetical protein